MPELIKVNGSEWLNLAESREVLRIIFPNYPELYPINPAPEYVERKRW